MSITSAPNSSAAVARRFLTSPLGAVEQLAARVGRMLVSLLMVTSVATGIVLIAGAPANADSCSTSLCTGDGDDGDDPSQPPITGGGGNQGEGTGGDYDTGVGAGNDGGSGGIVTPGTFRYSGVTWQPANPPSPIGGGNHLNLLWSPETKKYTYGAKCEGNYTWTDQTGRSRSAPYIGTKWEISGSHTPAHIDPADAANTIPETYTTTSGGYECIDPPEYTVYLWTCVIAGRAAYHRLPLADNTQVTLKPQQRSPFAIGGKSDPDLCADPADFGWNVPALKEDGTPRWPWGRYQLTSRVATQKCNYTDWDTKNARTGSYNRNTISCFGGLDWGNPQIDQLELFCNPPYLHKITNSGWHNDHTFTAEDCKQGQPVNGSAQPGSWTCGPVTLPTFNGRTSATGEFDVLDDAEDRLLKWDRPAIRGDVKEIRKRTVRLALGNNISPQRPGETTNGPTQPYKVVPQVDEWKHNWQQAMPDGNDTETGWRMAFMAPGVPSKPWNVTPTWAFEADFLTKRISSVEIDPETREWRFTLSDFWYTAPASCVGAPADLNVYRARNSQGRS